MEATKAGKAAAWLLCLVAVLSVARAGAGEKEIEQRWNALPERVRTVLSHVEEAGKGLDTVAADVDYSRSIPLLEEEEQSTGALLFHRPDKLVLKLDAPRNEDVYSNGNRWWVVSHDQEQVEIYRAVENPRQAQEAVFLKFGYGRSVRNLLAGYDVSLARTNTVEVSAGRDTDEKKTVTEYVLRFEPRGDREVPSRYSWIEIAVREGRWMPARLKLAEDGGRILHVFRLSKRRRNVDIEEGAFSYSPPEGYTILRPAASRRDSGR